MPKIVNTFVEQMRLLGQKLMRWSMELKSLKKINPSLLALISLGAILAGLTTTYSLGQFRASSSAPEIAPAPKISKITALGRIEPQSEIIKVSAPLIFSSDRVAQLLVQEGDKVLAGQIIAVLESRDRLQASLQEAEERVKVSQAKLNQVKAGAKRGEIEAQAANVRKTQAQWEGERASQRAALQRLEAQLEGERAAQKANILKLAGEFKNAQAEYERYRQLQSEGAISQSQFEAKEVTYNTSRQQLQEARVNLARIERTGEKQIQEAKANLARIELTGQQQVKEANSTLEQVAEVRPVDIQLAEAEVKEAQAAAHKVKTELNQSYIRTPVTGQILKIHSRPSEQISTTGLVEIGETQKMEVVAEIYQSDIAAIKVGQKATITGESFGGELVGKVRLIGMQVSQQSVFSNQPGENLDRKVIEVRIQLDPLDSAKVSSLTNSQVTVALEK
jgi:HlyD family secretion protein